MTKRTIHVDIDDDTWKAAKQRTVAEETTLMAVVAAAIIAYAQGTKEES